MKRVMKAIEDAVNSDTDECIIWPHAIDKTNGYGVLIDGHRTTAHRSVTMRFYGPPPSDGKHHSAHSCMTKACINPRHLRWATPKENTADQIVQGTRRERDKCSWTKIPEEAIPIIRRGNMETDRFYATLWGASPKTVQSIRYGWNRKGAVETHRSPS